MNHDLHHYALILLALQGALGAFDTIYHHEFRVALPRCRSARKELAIHALRSSLYAPLFIGLALWRWHGHFAWLLLVLFSVELLITFWDFVVEDQTRLLPASERITHTILAINGGGFLCLLSFSAWAWLGQPTGLQANNLSTLHYLLIAAGVGVAASAVRDAYAAFSLYRYALEHPMQTETEATKAITIARQFLVTGGTGFIGQAVIRRLLAQGHRVIVWTRDSRKAAWLFEAKVVCVTRLQEISANTQIDVVINLAGARILGWRWSAHRQQVLRRSRVQLTAELIDFLKQGRNFPNQFIQASAIGYYGIQAAGDDTELDEHSPAQAIFMSQLCQEWEQQAQRASEAGSQVTCLRFGLVLGKGGAWPMMSLPFRLGLGGRLGSGQQWYSWIHLHDLLNIIDFALQQPTTTNTFRVWNGVAPQALRQAEFARVTAIALRRPCLLPTPAWPMRLLLGEQADLLLEGQRVYPRALSDLGFQFEYPELSQALAQLENRK